MKGLAVITALLCGVGLAVQVGANSALRQRIGSPWWAAVSSFAIGLSLLIVILFIAQPARPTLESVRGEPWWIWLGGILGAIYIAAGAQFAPKLGGAGWLGLLVTGQMLASLVIDHYGLVGFEIRALTPWRLLGVGLLMTGVSLVLRG